MLISPGSNLQLDDLAFVVASHFSGLLSSSPSSVDVCASMILPGVALQYVAIFLQLAV
jgi:hypothetical protein